MPTSDLATNARLLARHFARHNSWVLRGVQLVIFVVTVILAFLLRFDLIVPKQQLRHIFWGLCILVPAKVVCFHLFRLDRGSWRYFSVQDLTRLTVANVLGSALGSLTLLLFVHSGFPRSVYCLDFMLCLGMTAGVRIVVRVAFEFTRLQSRSGSKRTLIYGAGDAGVTLLREIRNNPALAYDVVGFIDDSAGKAGFYVQRVKILGNGGMLPAIAAQQAVEMVLIAMPSLTGAQMTEILKRCHEAGVAYKTVPSLAEVIESNGLAAQIRDVAVEDLLGRTPVQLEESQIRAKIEGKVVAVTGAAGSIGSELCRQIARFHPAAIVGYDCAETPLFYLERELREKFPATAFHPAIGDIRNPQRLSEVLKKYSPSILYHAAAYKHVPMMEAHLFEAVENNVIGTWNVARAAAEHGIADFVMISSDKAVRPTNVMGATKRVTELLINSLQNGGTNYVSVRFGNVLGSNGSVIPLFKQQIAERKPLTITDPEMRRFFMTIPEAAQLVLQASTMGKGGEIFVLDMGEPVRIVDLARKLILLSGLRPDEDIKLQFTGIRPGEKLYEELAHSNEEVRPTFHAKIKIFANEGQKLNGIEAIALFRSLCSTRDFTDLVLYLKDLVPDYNPSAHVMPAAETAEHMVAGKTRAAVTGR